MTATEAIETANRKLAAQHRLWPVVRTRRRIAERIAALATAGAVR